MMPFIVLGQPIILKKAIDMDEPKSPKKVKNKSFKIMDIYSTKSTQTKWEMEFKEALILNS